MSIRRVRSIRRWFRVALIATLVLLALSIASLWGHTEIPVASVVVSLRDGRILLLQPASDAGEMGGPVPEFDFRVAVIGLVFLLPLLMLGCLVTRRLIEVKSSETGRCLECGYNLTNNISGICPECGAAVGVQKGGA